MERIPLLALLLHSFPESVLMGVAGLLLVGIRPKLDKALLFGLLQTGSSFVIRLLPLPLGYQPLLLLFTATVFLTLIYRIPFKKALGAHALSLLFLIISEVITLAFVQNHTNLTLETIMAPENAMIRVLVATPQMLVLALVSFIAYRVRGFHRTHQTYIKGY